MKYFIHLPMKMEHIVSSETSAIRTQTPGNYPKRNKLHLEHGESLKTRYLRFLSIVKPNRCTNGSNLFYCSNTLHVLDGLSVHHRELNTVHTATGVCQTDTADCLLASRQQYLKAFLGNVGDDCTNCYSC